MIVDIPSDKKPIKTKKIKPNSSNKRRISVANDSVTATSTIVSTKTHLVPIQTFSFLKWNINVDTLVRLFILA